MRKSTCTIFIKDLYTPVHITGDVSNSLHGIVQLQIAPMNFVQNLRILAFIREQLPKGF